MGLLPPNLRPDIDLLRTDLAVETLRNVLKDGWGPLALTSGVADAFTDQTGVSALGGATYEASGKYLHNPGGTVQIAQNAGTLIGANLTQGGGYAAAFDGNESQSSGSCAYNGSAQSTGSVGKDWGAGASRKVTQYTVISSNNVGFFGSFSSPMRLRLWGSNSGLGVSGVVLDAQTFTNTSSTITKTQTGSLDVSTAYRYHWVEIDTNGSGTGYPAICEVKFYEASTPANVASVGAIWGPTAAVSQVRFVGLWEAVDTAALNTDCMADVTADAGSHWSQVALTDLGKYDAVTRIVGGLAPVTAGTSVQWRWRTANSKTQRLHGVWMQGR